MHALADTLAAISPRCFRRWRLLGDVGALAQQLAAAGHEITDADADVLFIANTEIPADAASLVLALNTAPPDDTWRIWLTWPLDHEGRTTTAEAAFTLSLLMPPPYDLAEHMRALVLAGKAYDALELLENTRADLFRDDDERGRVATTEMLALFALDKALGTGGRLNRFARALEAFNRAATWLPRAPMAYEVLGAFWDRIGRPDMRVRISNTICHAYGGERLPGPPAPSEVPALPEGPAKPLRLLMIIHEASDFGTDTLYDGLCEILGDENVCEFPWKPTLHGRDPHRAMGYPCLFERGGEANDLEGIEAQLRAGAFDAVLYSDTLGTLPADLVARLAHAGQSLPWYVLDMWDQPGDYLGDIAARLPGVTLRATFKREKIAGFDYGANVHPMPFAYAERYASQPTWDAREGVFWAGKPVCGARRLVLDEITRCFRRDFTATYTQEEYRQRLQSALIGLCLFGNGFDTVRYWELPAHGVMLLAERPPIEIPNNFVDGVSAVFFDDLGDLEDKLAHYLDHPDEARAIAKAGHAHYRQHHTATARARQLLAVIGGD